jgi:hypothetical protein
MSRQVHNEIQNMHWFSFHITILVHITSCHNPNYDLVIKISKILKEVHYYVSNEKDQKPYLCNMF